MRLEKDRVLDLCTIEQVLQLDHHYEEPQLGETMSKLEEIDKIKREKNAIILAHYYQIPPIQLIADVRGDSLKLAEYARKIQDKNLVVCSTVVFMAEMVKILSPDKKVVVPSLEAGCSIAEGINGASVRRIRERFPGSAIVAYINTYADTKAEVNSVCTSSNAEQVIQRIEGNPVILLPDYYFALNIFRSLPPQIRSERTYLAYKKKSGNNLILEDAITGRNHIIEGKGSLLPVLEDGICVVHKQFDANQIAYYRKKDGIEIVMSHPEVNPEVAAVSDFVGGTGKMIEYVRNSKARKYLVISECDLAAPLREEFRDREFFTPCIFCPYMKRNTLDGLLDSLKKEIYEINLDPTLAVNAKKSLNKMFELTGGGR